MIFHIAPHSIKQNVNLSLNSQETPISFPDGWAMMGKLRVFFMRILEKIDCIITAPHIRSDKHALVFIEEKFQVPVSFEYGKMMCNAEKYSYSFKTIQYKSLPSNAIWRYRSGSTLAQTMAYCLRAPSHYLGHGLLSGGTKPLLRSWLVVWGHQAIT